MEALLDAARLGTGDAVAAIEEYAFGIPRRKGASRHVMVEVGVMYRMALTRAGIPWVTVPRSEWAKFVAGDGSAKKQQVSARVKRRWGFEDPCEDVVEAYGIMRWLEAQQRDITNTTNGG